MSTKIGIIGCGAFGLSAALELQKNKNYKVSVYDRSSDILAGATYANHNRHHYGFHYPRSQQTIDQINEGKSVFEYYFKNALFFNFHNYYCISQKKTKTNNYNYEKFLIIFSEFLILLILTLPFLSIHISFNPPYIDIY